MPQKINKAKIYTIQELSQDTPKSDKLLADKIATMPLNLIQIINKAVPTLVQLAPKFISSTLMPQSYGRNEELLSIVDNMKKSLQSIYEYAKTDPIVSNVDQKQLYSKLDGKNEDFMEQLEKFKILTEPKLDRFDRYLLEESIQKAQALFQEVDEYLMKALAKKNPEMTRDYSKQSSLQSSKKNLENTSGNLEINNNSDRKTQTTKKIYNPRRRERIAVLDTEFKSVSSNTASLKTESSSSTGSLSSTDSLRDIRKKPVEKKRKSQNGLTQKSFRNLQNTAKLPKEYHNRKIQPT